MGKGCGVRDEEARIPWKCCNHWPSGGEGGSLRRDHERPYPRPGTRWARSDNGCQEPQGHRRAWLKEAGSCRCGEVQGGDDGHGKVTGGISANKQGPEGFRHRHAVRHSELPRCHAYEQLQRCALRWRGGAIRGLYRGTLRDKARGVLGLPDKVQEMGREEGY